MSDTAPTRRRAFLRAFLASVLGTGLSRIAGAVRDMVVAAVFGAGAATDAFFIAFTVPNVFRRFVADEGLTGALIPALSQATTQEDDRAARKLANSVFTALLLANVVLCVAGIAGAKWLVLTFAWSYADDPAQWELTVSMTRWMFPFVALVSMVSFFEGVLNYRGHFFVPKLAPALVSAGIAGSAILLATRFEKPVYALVVGVLVGGVAHVLVNLPWLWWRWGALRPSFDFRSPRFRHVLREMGKVVAIGIFAQLNIFILRQFATSVGYGAVTQYWNANRLVDLSQGVVAVAVGSALLPNVSQAVADRDWKQVGTDFVGAVRLAAFFLLPAASVLLAFAVPLTALVFRRGQYTWEDTQWTAWTLQLMVPFLLAVAGMNIVKKVYFALDDRTTLIRIGILGVALTAALGAVFIGPLGIAGLGLALSVATTLQLACYLVILWRRLGADLGLAALVDPLGRMALASVAPAVVLWLASAWGTWPNGNADPHNLAVGAVALTLAGGVYLGVARALRIEELTVFTRRLTTRWSRS